jgi:hypothetical protein
MLKKEWSYTSLFLWVFVAGCKVSFTFTFYFTTDL